MRTPLRSPFRAPHVALLAAALLSTATPSRAAGQDHPIWGGLEPGAHAVGFRVAYERDPSRPERPETRLDGSEETGPIGRLMQIGLWYPARAAGGAEPMTLGDYIDLQESGLIEGDRREEGVLTDRQRADLVNTWATYGIMTGVDLEAWRRLHDTPMRALRDAAPAAGPFPLILMVQGGSGSLADLMGTAEYLASHGYAVITTPSRGQDRMVTGTSSDARLTESILQDAEYALRHAAGLDFVALRDLGVLGMSRGGTVAYLLAMRNPTVDAVVSLDGTTSLGLISRSPWFDPLRMTAPVLAFHTDEPRSEYPLLDTLRYADVHIAALQGIHHVDFSALGMIHTALGVRNQYVTSPDAHIRAAHEAIDRRTRLFLDAHVKDDARAAARLAELPGQTDVGEAPGLVVHSRRPGQPAPLSSSLLAEMIWRRGGVGQAIGLIRAARRNDPAWIPFPEPFLNAAGYRFMELGRGAEAVGVLRLNTELYPDSPNVWDSLGESLKATGDREAAIRSYERSLELNPGSENARRMLEELRAAD